MKHERITFPLLVTGLGLLAAPALAQTTTPAVPTPTAGVVDACIAIDSDANRLACYDRTAGRAAKTASQADAEAAGAEATQKVAKKAEAAALPPTERARKAVGDIFTSETAPDAVANAGKGSLLDSRWELAKDSKLGTFNFRAYKPVYLLPLFLSSNPNNTPSSPNANNNVTTSQDLQNTEAKFQLSFKTKAVENLFGDNGDVWMGYTQSSRWQVYDGDNSRPFRESDYEPEVMLVFRNNYSILGWKGRMAAVGVNHQSNGRADPLSRSWNRVIFNVGLDRENWAVNFRPWVRIDEDREDDNNPDIEDFMGRGDMTLVHTMGRHEFALTARHSLRGGDRSHGAVGFDWGFPITNQLRGHLQVFDGYGESLIDYNHRATYVGFGVSLLEWY